MSSSWGPRRGTGGWGRGPSGGTLWWYGRRGRSCRGGGGRSGCHLCLDCIDPAVLLYKVIDEVDSLLVDLHIIVDTHALEQSLHVWVQVVHIKTLVGIPANMADVSEVRGSTDVLLGKLLLLVFVLVFTLALGDCVLTTRLVQVNVHGCRGRGRFVDGGRGRRHPSLAVVIVADASLLGFLLFHPPLVPLHEFLFDGILEPDSFILAGEIQAGLEIISFKCVEVISGCLVSELVVDFLFPYHLTFPDVENSNKVGVLEVVLDKADHTTIALCPSRTRWRISRV